MCCFLWIIAGVVLLLSILVVYMGVFKPVTLEEKIFGPVVLVGKRYKGPYSSIGPVFDDVCKGINSHDFVFAKMAGIYYDDPKTVAAKDCRSLACAMLDSHIPDSELAVLEKEFIVFRVPRTKGKKWTFTVRNNFSYVIGAMKFYYSKAVKESGIKSEVGIEICDGLTTEYFLGEENQEVFHPKED